MSPNARIVLRNDRTPLANPPPIGSVVYLVPDEFNLAHDDSRIQGMEYVAVSTDPSKDFYFTMPHADLGDAP